MAFRVFEDAVNGTLFVFILVCTPIVILVTFLRFVATKKAQRKFGLEDYLALLALLFNLAFNALILWSKYSCADSIMVYIYGAGRNELTIRGFQRSSR